MIQRLLSLIRVLTRRRDFEEGMSEELRFHIEQYTDELVRSGFSPENAARRARIELGSHMNIKGTAGKPWACISSMSFAGS